MTAADAELESWLTLIRAPGVGPVMGARLLETLGSPAAALAAGPSAWRAAGVPEALQKSLRAVDGKQVEQDLQWIGGPGRGLLTLQDPRYPPRLREIAHPPLALFYQGDIELALRPQLAMVGARSATPQGIENARGFAAELVRRGFVVTSGLALGIDGAAHRGALEAGGATIAVCGTGLDRVYPARHRDLAHQIAERGLLLSEFPPGTAPKAEHFPRRNRLISGLSLGVLVVEAALESGSLITARFALEQGREVFAIPGSIHSPLSRGCHALLRQGAKLTESVNDILEELAPFVDNGAELAPQSSPSSEPELDPMHQSVLEGLGFEATPFDILVERLRLPVENLSALLLALELQGHVVAAPGGSYLRVRR